jgi:rhamnulokinase
MKLEDSPLLDMAESFLMMPDLFHWLLTGEKANEITDATTTQFYNPQTGDWARRCWSGSACRRTCLGRSSQPGTNLGRCGRRGGRDGTGRREVVLPGTHDTASAVMAVPAEPAKARARLVLHQQRHVVADGGRVARAGDQRQMPRAELHQRRGRRRHDAAAQEHRRAVAGAGVPPHLEAGRARLQLGANWCAAEGGPPLVSLIDPDDPDFIAPRDMPQAIRDYCRDGQPVPESEGAVIRCALESLALRYRMVLGAGRTDRRADRNDSHRRRRHAEPRAAARWRPTPATAASSPARSRRPPSAT